VLTKENGGEDMDMDERKIKILEAIINDYIYTGEPVGSRTIAKKYDLGISSATIRNEMSDLEELGYLAHIHTSSGRKPSDKGYRLYVDRLMKLQQLTPEEEMRIKGQLINLALYEVDKIVKAASILLSELTNLTCIVKTPSVIKGYLKTIQLIRIDDNEILTVIVTDSNIIRNSVIRISKPIDPEVIIKLNNLLNVRLKNLTVEEINLEVINNLKKDLIGYDEIFNAIIPVLYDTLNSSDSSEIHMEGAANILNYSEYNDIERAREFLTFINNKDNIKNLLNNNQEMSISIGEENLVPETKECSIISKVYTIGNKPVGTIGLIGPTRMQYSKVISILTKVIREVNENFKHNFDDW
jgi:heat-inducible transcriptional repressor